MVHKYNLFTANINIEELFWHFTKLNALMSYEAHNDDFSYSFKQDDNHF